VAFAAPSGVLIVAAPSEFRPSLVEVLKGRKRREMNVGIAAAMRRIRTVVRSVRGLREGRLKDDLRVSCSEVDAVDDVVDIA
jgi:hypothetical protein